MESVGLSCQKLVFLFLALKLAQKRPKTVARILRPNFFGFDTYKLHVQHSRLLLTKKGPRNDTRSPTNSFYQLLVIIYLLINYLFIY